MKCIANQDPVGKASIIDLVILKSLDSLTFGKIRWFKREITKVTRNLEKIKSRTIY